MAHVVGTSFCVYNSQFVFVHIGVEVPSKLEVKDTLAILPSDIKMQAVGNIGIVSTAGSIASISIETISFMRTQHSHRDIILLTLY